jgi:hypothetical protein
MPLLRPTIGGMPALEEPRFLERLSLSLPLMAIFTGAGLRTYRSLVLQFGWSDSWIWIAGTFIAGAVFLFVMVTLHLGYYAQREWWWRAPLFAVIEAGTEIAVSLALTLLGFEVVGSIAATLEDWQSTSVRILFFRMAGITLFSVVLALVSTLVRLLLLKGREIPHHLS